MLDLKELLIALIVSSLSKLFILILAIRSVPTPPLTEPATALPTVTAGPRICPN